MSVALPDLSNDECKRILRRMELEAYSTVVSAFRAQGELSADKQKLLQDLGRILKISSERHKAEMRRAANDDELTVISNNLTCEESGPSWVLEGRRIVPLMPRLLPPTLFTSLATTVSNLVAKNPNICRPKESVIDEGVSRHIQDPDEEDTLSPVMVPALSPEGMNNNNMETNFTSFIAKEGAKETGKLTKPAPLILTPRKRPRSPLTSNSGGTPSKNSAILPPNPIQTATSSSANLRSISAASAAPPAPRLLLVHQSRSSAPVPRAPPPPGPLLRPSSPASAMTPQARLRVRGPVPQFQQRALEQPRPFIIAPTAAATSVAARTPMPRSVTPGPQLRPVASQVKVVPRQGTPIPAKVTPTPMIASNSDAARGPLGKANVIVLQKNSTAVARSISTNQDLVAVPKGITAVAPGAKRKIGPISNNVRIITVPSSGSSAAAAAATGMNVKSSTPNTQGNVIVLDLSAEQLSKTPLVLPDILRSPQFMKDVNGALAPNAVTKVQKIAVRNLEAAVADQKEGESAMEKMDTETNGNHVVIETVEENVSGQAVADPHIEFIYANGEEVMTVEQTVDIFGTLSSADLDITAASTEEGSRIIIQDDSSEQITS